MKTKTKKADLEGKKALFFQVGLIIALSFALLAFEWPTKGDIELPIIINRLSEVPPEIIPNTKPEDIIPPPPPPVIIVAEVIRIHDDKELISESDPDIFQDFNFELFPLIFETRLEEEVDETIPFMLIEEKPSFMGGDYNTFTTWVSKQLNYPELAAITGLQGRVTLQFLIDTDGSVKNIQVLRGIDKLLDEEAIRVVSLSPKWTPGRQRGKPTKVIFTFPVTFKLN